MGKQIFEGLKILDFTWAAAGPVTTKNFADHGACVIRVESHTRPETCRLGPPFKDGIPGINRSAWMPGYNSSKYGISLDLNKEKGREIVKRILLEWKPDIMAESYSPKGMAKWELDYEHVRQIRPDIIYFSSSMQGHTGPHRMFAGYGMHMAALAGYAHLTGWPDRPPAIPFGAYTDFISPFYGAIAVLGALDYRRRTGQGQHIDLSQYECGLQFLAPALMDYALTRREVCRMGNRNPLAAPHGIYPCKGEETWCSIAVFTDDEWNAFCEVVGNLAWTEDPRFKTLLGRKENEDDLDRLVAEWTQGYSPEDVMHRMQARGVPAGVVHPASGLFEDPQLAHRGFFVELQHTEIGPLRHDGLTFQLSKTPGELRMSGPCLGEHNEYVYKEILGLSDDEIGDLMAESVITTDADLPH